MTRTLTLLSIVCLVVNLSALPAPQDAPNPPDSREKEPKAISITRFIPGIYQLESRQYVKGILLLSSFAGCITGFVINNNRGNRWFEKYIDSTNVEDIVRFREYTEKSLKKRNLFVAGIFTVWLAHLIDLKFFKSKKGGVKSEMGKNSINIGFFYSF